MHKIVSLIEALDNIQSKFVVQISSIQKYIFVQRSQYISIKISSMSNKSVQECLRNSNSHLHTKLQLFSFKSKKVGKTVQNEHCAVQNVHCAVQNVHCANPTCQTVQYKNVYKFKFTPSHQKSPLYLKKKVEKQCKMCTLQNVHCAHPNCQKNAVQEF